MPDGLYAAASGLAAQQARLDALANDVANLNTAGYKRSRLAFRDLLHPGTRVGGGVAVAELGRSFVQGPMLPSDSPLSLAIGGQGFFQVRRADGALALTRGGDFRLDAGRNLVLSSGERLEPPIAVPAGAGLDAVSIASNGSVTVAGKEIGRVTVVTVSAPTRLLEAGDGMFLPTEASGKPAEATGAAVRQGFLEGSSADLASSMLEMIEAQRVFELSSRAVHLQDQLLEIANGIRR
jgi:flagellar basal-body rod protein FlgG